MVIYVLWFIKKKRMIDYEKLKKSLDNYRKLTIFQNDNFTNLAEFNWSCSFSSISNGTITCNSHEDAIRNRFGVFFGFSFTLNPYPGKEKYKALIDNLSGQEREDRYGAKILARKFHLVKDKINIEKALIELHNNEFSLASNALSWFKLSQEEGLNSFINLIPDPEKIPEEFILKKIGKRTNLNKEEIIQNGFGIGEVYQLFLYGDELHLDSDKYFIYNILKNQFNDFLEVLIDMYSVIFYKLITNLILPMVEGEILRNIEE